MKMTAPPQNHVEKDKSKVGSDIYEALLFTVIPGLETVDEEVKFLKLRLESLEIKIQGLIAQENNINEQKKIGIQKGIAKLTTQKTELIKKLSSYRSSL
ncbi:TPA: hypothetical protein N3A47_004458 [Salmonella enterica subsp. houtenae serovar 47:z36:-]|nr:hypothetical protein HPG92_11025 [Salmonella enterica]HCM1978881.1 hypothetical protein [Salmonella enterica subsp. houtenae serovar 47:z36:-]